MKSLFVLALTLLGIASFADGAPVIPPDKFVYCTVCHGVQLKGNPVVGAPRLSGMAEWYVIRQLHAFKNSWRGVHKDDLFGMDMRPMASILTDAEIELAAAFVSAVDSEPPPVTISGNEEQGKTLYTTCAACHGQDGKGIEAMGGPALTDLNDWYLVRQLKKFKDGARGANPGNTYGAQMRAAAQILEDDDAIRDVVSYIDSLQSQ